MYMVNPYEYSTIRFFFRNVELCGEPLSCDAMDDTVNNFHDKVRFTYICIYNIERFINKCLRSSVYLYTY